MQKHRAHEQLLAAAAALLTMAAPAFADRTDPSLVPPDVTLTTNPSTGSSSSTSAAQSGSAPGLVAPAGSTGAGSAAGPTNPGAAAGPQPGLSPQAAAAGLTIGPNGMTMLGNFAIPKSGKITATISKPPGTPIGGAAPPPAGSGPTPLPVTAGMGPNGSSAATNGPAADQNKPDPIATIETDKGTIEVRLFRKYAPRTVENFIDLCTRGFYNGLTFHRVEPGFCIQGGDPNGSGTGIFIDPKTHQPRYLHLEVSANLKHNGPGVVAMARSSNQDSASCQFYITLAAQPSLDMQYAVFGGVISGMNVVQSIQKGDKIRSASVREQD